MLSAGISHIFIYQCTAQKIWMATIFYNACTIKCIKSVRRTSNVICLSSRSARALYKHFANPFWLDILESTHAADEDFIFVSRIFYNPFMNNFVYLFIGAVAGQLYDCHLLYANSLHQYM